MAWTIRSLVVFAALGAAIPAAGQPGRLALRAGESADGPGDSPKGEEPGDDGPSRPHPWDGMDLSLDVGAGLLEWFHADLTYLHSRHWTLGVGLGFFPLDRVLRRVTGLDSFSADVEDVDGLRIHGEVGTQLISAALFTRWYPWGQTFYLEANLSLWRLTVEGKGDLTHPDVDEALDIDVTARIWVPMVGLHLGWRFYFMVGAYIDLGLGLNGLLAPDATVDISGVTASELQDYPEVAALMKEAQTAMVDSLRKGASAIPDAVPVFPTIYLRLGWAVDFNPP